MRLAPSPMAQPSLTISTPMPASSSNTRTAIKQFFSRNPHMFSLIGLLALCVMMMCVSNEFMTTSNLSNVLRQVSINAIIAVGMTMVILTGGIDLSVGSVMALSMTGAAAAMLAGVSPMLAIPIA